MNKLYFTLVEQEVGCVLKREKNDRFHTEKMCTFRNTFLLQRQTRAFRVTWSAQLFDDFVVIGMATKENKKIWKISFRSTHFLAAHWGFDWFRSLQTSIMPLAQHMNLRSLRCQSEWSTWKQQHHHLWNSPESKKIHWFQSWYNKQTNCAMKWEHYCTHGMRLSTISSILIIKQVSAKQKANKNVTHFAQEDNYIHVNMFEKA
jgi:hypothetical protein